MKKTRKQIEKEINRLISELDLDFSFEDVKEMIWSEEELDELNQLVGLFAKKAPNLERLNEICRIVSEAWNNFPHQSLGGLSPNEMMKGVKRK